MINRKLLTQTAVCLLTCLSLTACTVTEARPTIIPAVPTSTSATTAVPPSATPTAATEIDLPIPTQTPTPLPPVPTAVLPQYIEPTPTATPDYPLLPTENSVNFTLQNQYGGMPQAILVEGNVAYLAVGPRLIAVDVTDPANPQFLSQSPILGDTLLDIAQEGAFIYGAAGRAGLVVLDVSDPANIRLVNNGSNYSEISSPNAIQVASSDGRIFLGNVDYTINEGALIWFDLATDGQPTLAGTMPLNEQAYFSATGDLLFIPTKAGIQVVDPQDPTQELSRIGAEEEIYKLFTAVQNSRLYLIYMGQGTQFTIYDLADPTNPQVVPQNQPVSLDFLSELTHNDNIVATSYTFGEFGYCSSQITIIDISEPDAPQEKAEFDPENCISQMTGSGERLYVAGISGLQIFSTADPANLQLLGTYTNPFGIQTVEDILPGQPISYLLTNEGRGSTIVSLNLNEPTPSLLGQTEPYAGGQLLQLLTTDQTLAVSIWNNGVLLFDTSNPTDLTQLYAPPEESDVLGSLNGTVLVDKMLYMPLQNQYTFTGSIGVFTLQDPTNPQQVKTVNTGLSTFEAMIAGNGTLYLLGGYEERTLVIIDIQTPLEPTLVSTLILPEMATRLAVVGSTLYAMCDGYSCQSLSVIDVSDAERPFLLSQWNLPFDVVDSVTVDQRLYTISSDNTIRELDTSQPTQPRVIGSMPLPGRYGRLTAAENALYVSAGSNGLYMLTVTP